MSPIKLRKFLYWIAFTVVFPILVLLGVWMVGYFSNRPVGTFGEFFGTGDMLPIAAILLLTVATDIRDQDANVLERGMVIYEVYFFVLGVLGVLGLLIYGALKSHAVELVRGTSAAVALVSPATALVNSQVLDKCAGFCWVFVLYAIVHAATTKRQLMHRCV